MGFLWPTELQVLFDITSRKQTINIGPVQLAKADSERVIIVFGLTSVGAGSVRIAPRANIGTSDGITMTAGTPITFTNVLHGPLPALEWWGNTSAGALDIEITELFLRRRPRETGD